MNPSYLLELAKNARDLLTLRVYSPVLDPRGHSARRVERR